jgi:hypothetical protein
VKRGNEIRGNVTWGSIFSVKCIFGETLRELYDFTTIKEQFFLKFKNCWATNEIFYKFFEML